MSLGVLANFVFQYADFMAFLLLAALGLIIILGVANIINLAHGELIMLGAYVASIAYHAGLPLPLAVAISAASLGLFGILLEVLFIRRFYDDRIGALVATWGLSLILSQGMLLVLGPSMPPIPLPQLTLTVAGFSFSGYRLLLFAVALALIASLWAILYRTKLGIQVRATIQNQDMAFCLGTDTRRIYLLTFALGSALAGMAGALYAPTSPIGPTFGVGFIAPAFITVVVGGGTNPILGAFGSSVFLSLVSTPVRMTLGPFLGLVALLLSSLIVIRFLPLGISHALLSFRRQRINGQMAGDGE